MLFRSSEQLHNRPSLYLRLLSLFFDHAFAVNGKLLNFAVTKLHITPDKVSFLANFADLNFDDNNQDPDIPDGNSKSKLICLANLRPQKDHDNLLDAFKSVRVKYPDSRLYLVGGHFNDDYYHGIIKRMKSEELLVDHVHVLGSRNDVASILSVCDIGVLSSVSEGLPVSLLEYGLAGLPVVCTNVGDCSFVLDDGRCGRLVEPGNHNMLAEAIIELLDKKDLAYSLGTKLKDRVNTLFSINGAISQIINVYHKIKPGV